jgi:hypothetical protein
MRESRRKSVINYIKCSTNLLPLLLITVLSLLSQLPQANGHGRLIEPPSRSSAWRYGFNTPVNYNDHELFCGGFTKQHQTNGSLIFMTRIYNFNVAKNLKIISFIYFHTRRKMWRMWR